MRLPLKFLGLFCVYCGLFPPTVTAQCDLRRATIECTGSGTKEVDRSDGSWQTVTYNYTVSFELVCRLTQTTANSLTYRIESATGRVRFWGIAEHFAPQYQDTFDFSDERIISEEGIAGSLEYSVVSGRIIRLNLPLFVSTGQVTPRRLEFFADSETHFSRLHVQLPAKWWFDGLYDSCAFPKADFNDAIAAQEMVMYYDGVEYDAAYPADPHWRMVALGAYVHGEFTLPTAPASAKLNIRHLTSAAGSCPGGGFSPVNIIINGTTFKSCYDPAQNHGGTHAFVTDEWEIGPYLRAGQNYVRIVLCNTACSFYWISDLSVRPASLNCAECVANFSPRPVILVHGWRGNPETWEDLKTALVNSGYVEGQNLFLFDYSQDGAINHPKLYASRLKEYVATLKTQQNIQAKFDIVCHSMGAMVSRWYMERLGGAQDVNQWIGLAPVNNGAAIASAEPLVPDVLKWFFPRLIGTEPAVTDMAIKSSSLAGLNYEIDAFDLATWGSPQHILPNVTYRNLMGMNYANGMPASRSPFFPVTAGQTLVAKKDSSGKLYGYWTHQGDGLVAIQQSKLIGNNVGNEVFEGLNHTDVPKSPAVIGTVINYLLNPCAPLVNNCPANDPEDDHETVGKGNQGYVFQANPTSVNLRVGSDVRQMNVFVSGDTGSIDVNLSPPSQGFRLFPVASQIECVRTTNGFWCNVTHPEPGDWSVVISLLPGSQEPVAYRMLAFYSSPIDLDLSIDRDDLAYVGQPVRLQAILYHDGSLAAPPDVRLTLTRPDGVEELMALVPEPAGSGGEYSYSRSFVPTIAGLHQVSAIASDRNGQNLERMAFARFFAKQRIRLSTSFFSGEGTLVLTANGTPFDTAVLEVSDDLSRWSVERSFQLDERGTTEMSVAPSGAAARRFYRMNHTGQ